MGQTSTCHIWKWAMGTKQNILGVQEGVVNGKYLGLLYVISKNNKFTFRYIRDRLWRSLQCWKCIPLASAGGEVLIKAIAQAIPNYCMRIYLFPHSLAKELQKMINSFWWGTKRRDLKGINWLSRNLMDWASRTSMASISLC
ncbi:hypothetical protein GmHk_05G012689 [Glycine max]|nr:hypothetical protein GmHk_05G012689 [Glycine max]